MHVAHVPNDLTKSKKQDRHHSSPQASDSSSSVLECVEPKRLGMLFFIYTNYLSGPASTRIPALEAKARSRSKDSTLPRMSSRRSHCDNTTRTQETLHQQASEVHSLICNTNAALCVSLVCGGISTGPNACERPPSQSLTCCHTAPLPKRRETAM